MHTQKKIKCSVSVLTLNSATHLARCLKSLSAFDDVIILDGNSTDSTRDVAREFGIPVYRQYDTEEPNVRIKNFTELRVKADALAKHDWIFLLDSDDYAGDELTASVRSTLAGNPDPKTMYLAEKKLVMGERVIEHAYNTPICVPRLYNRKSGVGWKGSKTVHEKLFVPPDVETKKLHGAFYSHTSPNYTEAVRKDDYYLSLTRAKLFAPGGKTLSKRVLFSSIVLNFSRAVHIALLSLLVYLQHGFKESLPPQHVWRYMRYHLIISWYRVKQVCTL